MKFSLKPCLKSLLYLSNQCCEIHQKYITPKTKQGNKVVKNDFSKVVSQDFSKTKRKNSFLKMGEKNENGLKLKSIVKSNKYYNSQRGKKDKCLDETVLIAMSKRQ